MKGYSVKLDLYTEDIKEQLENGLQKNLKEAALIWHGGVVRQLSGARRGRSYTLPVVKAKYQASAPGEAPATRTGDLRKSYGFRIQPYLAEIGSPLDYALFLEKGTRNMAPRPHLAPAYRNSMTRIHQALGRRVL